MNLSVACLGLALAGGAVAQEAPNVEQTTQALFEERRKAWTEVHALRRRIGDADASVSRLLATQQAIKGRIEQLTAMVAGQQDADVRAHNEQVLAQAREMVEHLDQRIVALRAEIARGRAEADADPMVVDARDVPSGLRAEVEAWLASETSAPDALSRLRKGWQAYVVGDLHAAAAWIDDASNHDPSNDELREVAEMMDRERDVADGRDYRQAMQQAAAAAPAASEPALRKAEHVLVVSASPGAADLHKAIPVEQRILAGDMLPERMPELNALLASHPDLRPQLEAAWKRTCADRDQKMEAGVAHEATVLKAAADSLHLPSGHIDETLGQDPALQSRWIAAVRASAQRSMDNDSDAIEDAIHQFDAAVSYIGRSEGTAPLN